VGDKFGISKTTWSGNDFAGAEVAISAATGFVSSA
jgi:hypothetical protein